MNKVANLWKNKVINMELPDGFQKVSVKILNIVKNGRPMLTTCVFLGGSRDILLNLML